MSINKTRIDQDTGGDDMGKRAVMKPVRKATQPEGRPKSPKQKPDEAPPVWKGGIDKFSEGG